MDSTVLKERRKCIVNKITDELLKIVSDFTGEFKGAFNIRENGECAGRQSDVYKRQEKYSKIKTYGIYIYCKIILKK